MKVLVYGSLNIDKVYSVPHFVAPGETLSSTDLGVFAGGKGLNQAIALSKAGCEVAMAGKVGVDGKMLTDLLNEYKVCTKSVSVTDKVSTGHAIIQVNEEGQNCIILFPGANNEITPEEIDAALSNYTAGDYLVLQNEINNLDIIVEKAYEKGLIIVLNPSPYNDRLNSLNYAHIHYLLLNEVEGEAISGTGDPDAIVTGILKMYPSIKVVLTLGHLGSLYAEQGYTHRQACYPCEVVDTTAAGDTYTGYFISSMIQGKDVTSAMDTASRAAAIACSRKGAAASVPYPEEL